MSDSVENAHPVLGAYESQYRARSVASAVAVLAVLLIVFCVFLGLVATGNAGKGGLIFGLCLLAALGSVAATLSLVTALKHRKLLIKVYEHGFTYTDNQHDNEVVRWEDVHNVWYERRSYRRRPTHSRRTTILFSFQWGDNPVINLSSNVAPGLIGFGNTLQERVSASLLPKVTQAVKDGQIASFGPMKIDRNSIANSQETLAWSEVETIQNLGQAIIIRRKNQASNWMRIQSRDIPNFPAFLAVISQYKDIQ